MQENTHPFDQLTPDFIMDAIDAQGYWCDGRNLTLNSYENRVYQVGIEEAEPIIAKFYRPQRWSNEAIVEEHTFTLDLAAQELPVVAPLQNAAGETLFEHQGFRFALYPRRGGRAPELDNPDHLYRIGQLLGRIHAMGAEQDFSHRPRLDSFTFGEAAVEMVLNSQRLPEKMRADYQAITTELLAGVKQAFASIENLNWLRVHGDNHIGNMLWRDDTPNFVDFDDSRMAPAVQDIWMLLSGERDNQLGQLSEVIDGYNEFYDFRPAELALVEPLRALRMVHYASWLAKRWDDPAFPQAFPWFGSESYWLQHLNELRHQISALEAPVLQVY